MDQSITTSNGIAAWKPIVARFQQPSLPRALWQLANTLGGYGLIWYLIYLSAAYSSWLVLPLAILAAGFVVRLFYYFP